MRHNDNCIVGNCYVSFYNDMSAFFSRATSTGKSSEHVTKAVRSIYDA